MANGASLLLPGSNLTNLIVLAHELGSGRDLAGAMLPAWVAEPRCHRIALVLPLVPGLPLGRRAAVAPPRLRARCRAGADHARRVAGRPVGHRRTGHVSYMVT
jgi:hypothetical protein